MARHHFGGWNPVRPFGLAGDRLDARPGEALAAHPDAVADRPPAAEHVIEVGVGGIDHDGAGRFGAGECDHLAPQMRGHAEVGALIPHHVVEDHPRIAHRPGKPERIGAYDRTAQGGNGDRGRDNAAQHGLQR